MGPRNTSSQKKSPSSPSIAEPEENDDSSTSSSPRRSFPSYPLLFLSGLASSSIPIFNAESLSSEPDFAPECLVLSHAMVDSIRNICVTSILSTQLRERAMDSEQFLELLNLNTISRFQHQQHLVIANSKHVYVVNPFVETALSGGCAVRPPSHVLPALSLKYDVEVMEFVRGSSFEQTDPFLLASSEYEVGLYSFARSTTGEEEQDGQPGNATAIWHENGYPFGVVEHPKVIRMLKDGKGLMGGLSEDAGGGNSWFQPELIRFDLMKGTGTREMQYEGFRCAGYSGMDVGVTEDEKMMFVCGGRWGVKAWALDQSKCLKEIDKARSEALLVVPEKRLLFTELTRPRNMIRAWDLRKLEEPMNEFPIETTPSTPHDPFDNAIIQLCRSTGEDRFVAVSKDYLCLWNSSGKVYAEALNKGSCKFTGCCLFPHEQEGENPYNAIELAERMAYLIMQMTEEGRVECQITLNDGHHVLVPRWMIL